MTPAPRSDAIRSRARILAAARTFDPSTLRLNEVARFAGVGVGTVYRHFPHTHALVEAIALDDLERYRELARAASAESDPVCALELLVRQGLALQLEDGGLQAVLLADRDSSPATAAIKDDLWTLAARVLDAATASGRIRPDLTATRLVHLMCGVEHAARLDGDPEFHVEVLLAGIRVAS